MSRSAWAETHASILYWLNQPQVPDSIELALELLNRLVDEEQILLAQNNSSDTLPEFFQINLLNLILNHWRKFIADGSIATDNTGVVDPQTLVDHVIRFHELAKTANGTRIQPNTQSFAMILDGAASFVYTTNTKEKTSAEQSNEMDVPRSTSFVNGVDVADELVRWIIKEASECPWVKPNVYTFSSLMNAWAKSQRPDAPDRVEALLDQMHDLHLEHPHWDVAPNHVAYTTAIDTWAKLGRVDRVEQLLQDMYSAYQDSGLKDSKPNILAFNGLLVALAKAGEMDRAESVLNQMEDLYASDELDAPPSVISYSTVLDAFAKSKERGSAKRAEAILRQMRDRGIAANAISWNTVIDAYAKEHNPNRAESLLHEMNKDYLNGNANVKPTMRSYGVVLSAWATKPSPQSGERGEQLLNYMKQLAASGELEELDLIVYNTVLACWAKTTAKDAASKAKQFLEQRIIGDGMQPDAYSYNTVMSALTRGGNLTEAESLLDSLQEQGVAVDATPYNTLLYAWVKSKSKSAPGKVMGLYEKLKEDPHVEADLITMNTLLHFYSTIGDAQTAETLLNEMSLSQGSSKVEPDAISFNTVVAAWTRSKVSNAPERGEAVLKRMLDLGNDKVRPNTITFNSLLNAWVKIRPSEALPACRRLVSTMFGLAEQGNRGARPDAVTYGILIHAHGLSEHPEAQAQADIIFQEMHRRFKAGDEYMRPTEHTYGALIHGWCRRSQPEAGKKAEEILRLWMERAKIGEVGEGPKVFAYTAVINAYAKSADPYAAYKVDELLHLLLREHKNGNQDAKPTSRLFTAVLKVLVASPIPQKEESARRIVQLMKHYNIRPDRFKIDLLKRCAG